MLNFNILLCCNIIFLVIWYVFFSNSNFTQKVSVLITLPLNSYNIVFKFYESINNIELKYTLW